jgi:hypothetical protein
MGLSLWQALAVIAMTLYALLGSDFLDTVASLLQSRPAFISC